MEIWKVCLQALSFKKIFLYNPLFYSSDKSLAATYFQQKIIKLIIRENIHFPGNEINFS